MLARLRDVEQQLCTTATAVKLHLRLLEREQEVIGWTEIAALALVCGSIQQMQSEVSTSTTEILSLARKNLAGQEADEGDTETEDEDDGIENCQVKMEIISEEPIQSLQTEVEGEEKVTVKVEESRSGEARDERDHADDETGEQRSDNETHDVDVEMTDTVTVDERNETDTVEDEGGCLGDEDTAGDEGIHELEKPTAQRNDETVDGETPDLVAEAKDGGCVTVESTNSEEKVMMELNDAQNETKTAREECNADEVAPTSLNLYLVSENTSERQSDAENKAPVLMAAMTTLGESNNESKGISDTEKEVKQVPADATVMIEKDGNDAKKTEERKTDGTNALLETRIAKMKWWETNVNLLERTTFCDMFQTGKANAEVVNTFIASTTDMTLAALSRDPNLNSRLWIERVVKGLNHILDISTEPELIQLLAPIRESSLNLQQYCAAQYPNYLMDMHNDVKSVEYLQQNDRLDLSGLAVSAHFLLDQLQQDCVTYSTSQTLRTELEWYQLTLICESLTTWIKQLLPGHDQFAVSYLAQAIQRLGAFDSQFPKRIPVELLENLISMVQNTKLRHNARSHDDNSSISQRTEMIEANSDGNQHAEMNHIYTTDASTNAHDESPRSIHSTERSVVHDKPTAVIIHCVKDSSLNMKPVSEVQREKDLKIYIDKAKREAATTINNFQRSIKTGNCTTEATLHFRNIFTRMVSIITSNDSKYFRRRWIEQMVATCNSILESSEGVELAQNLAPLKPCCSKLQKYSSLHFPDYLVDMLNDVKTIDATPNMNDRKLTLMLRRILNQLRYDCIEYSKKRNAGVGEVRSEEKWKQLMVICEKITGCVKQIPPEEEYVQQTIRTISAFNRQFPNRIPAKLLETLCHNEQNQDTCTNLTPPVGETTTSIREPARFSDDSSTKKRNGDPDIGGPDLKRPAHNDSLDEVVNRVARNFMNAAYKAHDLIVFDGLSVTDAKTSKAFSDMKAKATASNAALHDLLKRDAILSENTIDCFKFGTQLMTKAILEVSGYAVDYSWLTDMIHKLRQLFVMGSCENVPSLDTMEQRVGRFQNRHDIKTAMSPVQSISSALLVDIERFVNAGTTLLRSHENWSRFAAVGNTLSDWMSRALQSDERLSSTNHISNKLLTKLQEFDMKFPNRLPSGLLRNTKSLCQRKYRTREIHIRRVNKPTGICVDAQVG